ncbi:mechanosensitive ion channel family protein [Methylosarcina fibrata]|uniref:mechanosensitive ion channel family protein n=1 Tax=Methylosarcina fibrata TaxID=105972 RepID=UPI0003A409E7|nr:mechanosensitive ion channel family protein [Methylosarcina fibrata]
MKFGWLLWWGLFWFSPWPMMELAGATTAPAEPVAVVVDGETLFYVRRLKSLPAQFRADKIAERIRQLAEDPYLDVDSITVTDDDISSDVMAGDTIILSVLDPDVAGEAVSRHERATKLAEKIRVAITQYREAHSIGNLLQGLLFALLATAGLIAFIYGLFKFFDKAQVDLCARVRRWLSHTRIGIFDFVIQGMLTGILKVFRLLMVIGSLYLYFSLILSFFPWTRPFAEKLFEFVAEPIRQIGHNIWNGLPNMIFLIIFAFIVHWFLGILRFFFSAVEKEEITLAGFYPDWAMPTYKICRFMVIVLAVTVAYPYLPGSDSRAFQGISIFLGVLFSLGSTSLIANMVAGVVLTYMRGFRIGDVVKIGDTSGRVTEVAMLVTRLRTLKNVEITIPNSVLMTNQVTNYSFAATEGRLILPTTVTIGYDAPWRQVHGLLLLAAERTGQVLHEPAPFVQQSALDDFYVRYELNVYAASADNMPKLYSELHQNIQDAFNEYGVQIMSPHYMTDPESAKVVPRERWSQAPATTS